MNPYTALARNTCIRPTPPPPPKKNTSLSKPIAAEVQTAQEFERRVNRSEAMGENFPEYSCLSLGFRV